MSIRMVFAWLGARRNRQRVILVALAAVIISGICWYIGMDTVHAITVALALLAIGITVIAVPDVELPPWDSAAPGDGDGIRRDVTRLSWSLRMRRGVVPSAGLRRVHDVAARRLSGVGLDVDDPHDRNAIEALLGRSAYRVLHPGSGRGPGLVAVVDCLDRLDQLDVATAADANTDRRAETRLAVRGILERFTPAFLVPIHRRSSNDR
ncbi:hypothetical protein [Leifsonia sp. Root112D2]|uniref:hypothetical protein n=1 Tax=Leifsonia sp. Root112D2 TaxID=1736426 RepID=UPI0012F98B63|nr:hypothetical protein [Leifsonia sp. Root112D2]